IHRRIRIERAGIDRRLNFAEIDLVELASECLVPESALGQATVQRHLAAFETLDACTGARGLSFATAAAGFSGTGADTAADAGTVFPRPRTVGDFVQLHRRAPLSSTTRTKCLTLAIMPRTCGVSGTWATRPIRLRPSPTNVSRWLRWRRIGLPVCLTRISLSFLLMWATPDA